MILKKKNYSFIWIRKTCIDEWFLSNVLYLRLLKVSVQKKKKKKIVESNFIS